MTRDRGDRAGLIAEQIEEHPTSTPRTTRHIGQPLRRKEDAPAGHRPDQLDRQHPLPGHAAHGRSLRSPMAHARITRVDVSAGARASPAWSPPSAARTSATSSGSLPCVWPVTDDIVNPDHPPLAIDEVRLRRRRRRGRRRPRPVRGRRRARGRSRSTTSRCRPSLDMEAALADGADLVHADLGTNKCFTVAASTAATTTRPRRRPRPTRRRGQAPVRPAAADPGGDGAARGRRRAAHRGRRVSPSGLATQIPHILRVCWR